MASIEDRDSIASIRAARTLARFGTPSENLCMGLLRHLVHARYDKALRKDGWDAFLKIGPGCQPWIELATSDPEDEIARETSFLLERLARVSLRYDAPASLQD